MDFSYFNLILVYKTEGTKEDIQVVYFEENVLQIKGVTMEQRFEEKGPQTKFLDDEQKLVCKKIDKIVEEQQFNKK